MKRLGIRLGVSRESPLVCSSSSFSIPNLVLSLFLFSYKHTFIAMFMLINCSNCHTPLKLSPSCGISCRNNPDQLKGCINDSRCIKYLLVNRFRLLESCILMLSEEAPYPLRHPTKHNMRMAMQWLVQGCRPGDSLVFHYSGHGSQQRNYTGDEVDGFDETLCPSDIRTQGMIAEDEINAVMVRTLPPGIKLWFVMSRTEDTAAPPTACY